MILLDSHVVLWLMTDPRRISVAALEAIAREDRPPGVSAASHFELAYAHRRGRIDFQVKGSTFFRKLRGHFEVIPISDEIAFEAAALSDDFHGDPMDRMIAATARVENRTLVTADRRILTGGVCKALW
jgi:PIN domain nuclease of toxin-antitoxin system